MLAGEFGTPADGAKPLLRIAAHVRTATFRWISAAAVQLPRRREQPG